jgi:hypothetical protein
MGSKHESEIPGLNIEYLKLKGFNVHELSASVDISVSIGCHNFHKMDLVTLQTLPIPWALNTPPASTTISSG